jgi:hypothetical protein
MTLLFFFMGDNPNRVKRSNHNAGFSVALIYQIFNNKNILALLVLRIAASLPSAVSYYIFMQQLSSRSYCLFVCLLFVFDLNYIFHAISPIVTKNLFLLDAQKNGFVMSYVGVMMAIAQGFVVGHVSARFKDHVIMFYATVS